jgi:putative ABC transport system permease protein
VRILYYICIMLRKIRLFFMQFATAVLELRNNRVRTLLSFLGISIGIFCIVAVFTMVDSLKNNINESLSGLGNNIMYINKFAWMPEPGEKEYAWWVYKSRPQCKLNELKQLKRQIPAISYSSMLFTSNENIKYNDNEVENITINAVGYDFNKLQNFELNTGRYFAKKEMEGSSNVILIGSEVKQALFGNINAVGRSVQIFGRPFYVIGVLKKRGKDITGFNLDNSIICSYKFIATFKNIEDDSQEFADNTIMIKLKENYNLEEVKYEIKGILRAMRRVAPGRKDNFAINVLSSLQSGIDGIFATLNVVGFFIGFFSLLVGAFGIANIMFVTVKERTSQIGLKKAIGAPASVILTEFLIESVLLCIIGGLVGIGLVMLVAAIATKQLDFKVTLSLNNFIIGVSISVIVGIIAGYLPAKRASKLDPVAAIRS